MRADMRHPLVATAIFLSTSLLCSVVNAKTLTLTQADQNNLTITLYSDNLALVQDQRLLGAIDKNDSVHVRDVSQQLHAESLQIKNAGKIIEQSLNRSTISYHSLLRDAIGKQIILVKASPVTNEETRQKVKLLNISDQTVIVEINGAIEAIPLHSPVWRFIFPKMPKNMLLTPSLTFKSTGKKTTNNILISYLSNGLEWKMDYVLELNQQRNKLNIKGLASLFNNTNTQFSNATIKLIAGNVSVPQTRSMRHSPQKAQAMMANAANLKAGVGSSIGDLQLYKLAQKTTLNPRQQTQVPFLESQNVPVISGNSYQFNINSYLDKKEIRTNPKTYFKFKNDKNSGLGIALPSGQARVFNPDSNNELQFIGASHFSQSIANDSVQLETGKAFDISIVQRQTNHEKTFNGFLVGVQLIINNSAKQAKNLDLSAHFNHHWEIISSTYPVSKKTAAKADWLIAIAPNSSTVINIKARLITK
jgi:hypothetical protein